MGVEVLRKGKHMRGPIEDAEDAYIVVCSLQRLLTTDSDSDIPLKTVRRLSNALSKWASKEIAKRSYIRGDRA